MGFDRVLPRTPGQLLLEAVDTSNYASVRSLVASGADIDYRGVHGETPLLKSLLCDDRRICRLLLDTGANVNIPTLNGYGPLSISCLQNDFEHVRMLLGKKAKVGERTREGWTPLIFASTNPAIFFDNSDSEFYKKISDLLYKYGHYHPDFHPVHIVRLLLEYDANPEESTMVGITPLMAAAGNANYRILQILMEAKAGVEERDTEGKTALMYASTATIEEIFESMIHLRVAGMEIQLEDFLSNPVIETLRSQIEPQKVLCVEELIDGGSDTRAVDCHGISVLAFASRGGNLAIVQHLVKSGADIQAKSPEGFTALHAAATGGNVEIVRYLLSLGSEIDPKMTDGETPLMAAVRNGREEIVSLLIREGADVRAKKFSRYESAGEPIIRAAHVRRKEPGDVYDRIFALLVGAGAE